MRSFSGCWTCRLRRKKCDETHPTCNGCAALLIACHYAEEKPEWMDGGARQDEVAEQLKREIREKAQWRRGERSAIDSNNSAPVAESTNEGSRTTHQGLLDPSVDTRDDAFGADSGVRADGQGPLLETSTMRQQRGSYCTLLRRYAHGSGVFSRTDPVLLMYYLEHVSPFMFPFYRPSALEGGRSWILEMIMSSPVVRQAALCQSSYFFALARKTASQEALWKMVLAQTGNAFAVLRQALQVMNDENTVERLHGAVRIMASIMQVQRFEVAVLSFENCRTHLNAALALFKHIADGSDTINLGCPRTRFNAILNHLGSSNLTLPAECIQIQGPEQAAFRFSTALLIFDDLVASTVLQEQPKLYDYHRSLLQSIDDSGPAINLEDVVGCRNWALLHIGDVAALDAWKQQCKRAGALDVMELVKRATVLKDSLEAHIAACGLDSDHLINQHESIHLLDGLAADFGQQGQPRFNHSSSVTRVWAHAAMIYLSVVVSGWQPASVNIRYHVGQIIELLTHQASPPTLLRTMVWPFCVAGCLAEPAQDVQFRTMVETLQPAGIFGTVRKALEIMESVWRDRDARTLSDRDLATCFRNQDDLVLLL